MATTTVPAPSDSRISGGVTAHHTISVEPFVDRRCLDVHEAVVERYAGEVVCICCRDVDVRDGATIDQVAREYARQFEADYVVTVTA